MSYVGGVGGKNAYADWTNVTVNVDETSYVKAISTENGIAYRTYVGGVVGFNGEGGHTFKNITSNIDVIGDVCDIGGAFGIAHYGNNFENITVTGNVTNLISSENDGDDAATDVLETGLIAGVWHNQTGYTVTFKNISATGTISTPNVTPAEDFHYDGLVGKKYSATGTGVITITNYADEDGITYANDVVTGDKTLYLVPSDYEGSTVIVPEGVDSIGNYAFKYNSNVKEVVLSSTVRDLGRGFDESKVEKVVLNDGLTTISSRAFRSTTALKEVVFSSTVTEIADNAFQKSGIKEIVIPANVKTIGETAFGASLIEKVTFEGDIAIQGYAFRGCTKLKTVVMNGYDVTFVKSTLNGRNSMWFCNGESNNPNTSDIDFYVKNEVIKERVLTAMGAERNNTDVVCEQTANENGVYTDKTTGETYAYASDNATLSSAITAEADTVYLFAGEYKMPSSNTTGSVTIAGTKDTVLDVTLGAYLDSSNGVTIEGVTIKTGTGYANGNGSDYAALYAKNVTYINCTFEGPMRVGRDGAKFINCTFTKLGNDYIWTYGNDVTFEGCTFNTNGKAILIYSDGGNEVSKVAVKDCVFNSTNGAKAGAIANQNCAAIEIHNYGNGVNLVTEGNTYDSNFSGEWRIKTYETGKPKVFVNGTEYTQIALDGKLMTIDSNKNVTVQE